MKRECFLNVTGHYSVLPLSHQLHCKIPASDEVQAGEMEAVPVVSSGLAFPAFSRHFGLLGKNVPSRRHGPFYKALIKTSSLWMQWEKYYEGESIISGSPRHWISILHSLPWHCYQGEDDAGWLPVTSSLVASSSSCGLSNALQRGALCRTAVD